MCGAPPALLCHVQGLAERSKDRVLHWRWCQNLLENGIQKPGIVFYRQTGMGSFFPPRSLHSHQQHCAPMNTAGQYWRSGGRGISLCQVGS